jgi:hypothetical protein
MAAALVVGIVVAVLLTAALLPMHLCRLGLFASDEEIARQQREARRHADKHSDTFHVQDALEIRAHRRARQFSYLLLILPGIVLSIAFGLWLITQLLPGV